MSFFRFKADRLPTAIITALFLLDLAVFFYLPSNLSVLIWMLVMLPVKACICSWNHHHQHVHTFKQTWANRLLEIIYAFHTGITTNAWVLHHNLGHHVNYLDQTKDESGWARKDGSTMGTLEYTLTIAITGYLRAYKVGKKHPKYQKAFLSAGLYVSIILLGLFYINWFNALFIFLIPMLAGYVITCWHTYYHHAGLHTDDHFEASYNVTHRWYNLLTGNLGFHTAHHWKQGVHWSKLPELHEEIKEKIPAHLFRRPCFPFFLLPG
ncbi:MAG: fatty acid desaturase [Bdellovibrionota bacterium]